MHLIENLIAKNGSVVVRHQGRLLASGVDPQAEAVEWVQRRLAFLQKVKTIFVLGAGSGYHIAELVKMTAAKIMVIEFSEEIRGAVAAIHNFDPQRVRMECLQNSRDLFAAKPLKAAVAQSFLVLQHHPSCAWQSDFYGKIKARLLGRDWASLNWQWRVKGFSPLHALPKIHGNDKPLTIYDLDNAEFVQNSSERERMLVKALRELVK